MNVSNPPTVDDALRALNQVIGAGPVAGDSPLKIAHAFLCTLVSIGLPEGRIESDHDGYIIEGAYQRGFHTIDDNADLMLVHANDLIAYVTEQRKYAAEYATRWIRAKDKPLDPMSPGLVVKAWDAPVGHPPSFWAGHPGDGVTRKTLSCDWYCLLPPLPQVPETPPRST